MNRSISPLLIAACLLGAHCGSARSTSTSKDQQASTIADAGPKLDCPAPAASACSTQADCPQNSGGPELYSCLQAPGGDVCTFEGQFDASCDLIQPYVQVSAQLDPSLVGSTGSLLFRADFPETTDGATLDCPSMIQQTSSTARADLNTIITLGVGVPPSAQTVIGFAAPLVPVSGGVLTIEAWSGPLDVNTQQPTGQIVGSGCLDHQTIEAKASGVQPIAVLVSAAGQ
jgi:hypothetical protein